MDGDPERTFDPRQAEGDEDESGDESQAWYLRDADDVVATLAEKESDYFQMVSSAGLVHMWRVAWAQYYGTDPAEPGKLATQQIDRVGPESEFTKFRVNEVRSFVKQAIQTAIGVRPAFKATAVNSDFGTLAGIESADRGIGYVMKTAMPESKRRRLLERSLVLGASFAHVRWDAEAGDPTQEDVPATDEQGEPLVDPNTGEPVTVSQDVQSGAPVITIGTPWHWFYDVLEEDDRTWMCVRERVSKWELAALYPEYADELTAMGGEDEHAQGRLFGGGPVGQSDNEDVVTLRHFYLARSAGAPDGRYIGYVDELPLWDKPLPIESKGQLPVVPVVPSAYIGAFLGYADHWDAISIQQLIDNVASDWASNLRAFGRLTLLNPKGSGLNLEALRLGLRAIDYTPGSDIPSFLTPPKVEGAEQMLGYLHRRMESVTQQNAVRRGDPQANIKSGTMAALFNQISIEYMSDIQESFDAAQVAVANIVLELVRTRSKGEFMVEVAGKGERPYWEAFSKQGLKGIRSIVVETVSPMMRSPAGRMEAYQAISAAPLEDRGAIIRGLDTGDWSGYAQVDKTCELRIVRENELLLKGVNVTAGAGDKHHKHVPDHYAALEKLEASYPSSPDQPPPPPEIEAAKVAIGKHIMGHLEQWQMMDPRLAMLLQIPTPPRMPGTPTGRLMGLTGGMGPGPTPGAEQGASAHPEGGAMPPDSSGPPEDMPAQPEPAEPAEAPQQGAMP